MSSRYIRQEALKEIGKEGQSRIRNARIVVIGVGALGTYVSEMLVRAGFGKVLLIDADKVDLTNLHRQTLFDEKDVGKFKVEAAKKKLRKINSEIEIISKKKFLEKKNKKLIKDYDLIIDCTDKMSSRHIINDVCEKFNKPWIYSAASGTKGNVLFVKDYKKFRELFNSGETFDSCEEIGVLNYSPSIIAGISIGLATKYIIKKEVTEGLLRFDAWNMTYDEIPLK